ncbi:hypothetical protein EBT25_18785, partial [bacterium]|nr:hypothetical protein [bacterium]
SWCTKSPAGYWHESPVDVFYVANPDRSKGHSNYFGMFVNERGNVMICNAESAFSEPITGVLCDDGEVLVSRYRHDFVTKGEISVDGGRDYTKTSGNVTYINVTVVDGEFQFDEVKENAS